MTIQPFPHGYQGDDRLNQIFSDRARLPAPLAAIHAWQTGLPDPTRAPRPATPPGILRRDLQLLAGFMGLTGLAAMAASPSSIMGVAAGAVSLYGMLGVTGRLRRLVVGHTHEAAHGVIAQAYEAEGVKAGKAWERNEFILDFGSSLTLTKNGLDYRRAHDKHHDKLYLGTLRDPDGMDLHAWGLWPGLGTPSLAIDVIATLIDPVWHAGMIASRLRSNFAVGTLRRRLKAGAALAALAGSAAVLPLPVWLMAIGLPWSIGYNTAALLQVLTEHPYGFAGGTETLEEEAARNWERVPLEPFPRRSLTGWKAAVAWAVWIARTMLLHVPSRLAVLDSSMIGHGWHHIAWPVKRSFTDWWNTSWHMMAARRAALYPREGATRVVWGLPEALRLQAVRFKQGNESESA